MHQKLLDMQKEYLIELAEAVIAAKQPNGHVKLASSSIPPGRRSLRYLLGRADRVIFLMPRAGAAIGVASGALGGALTEVGINNQFMKDVGTDDKD